tara:strand:+ start:336 stop:569 length:234 start_codon:yes stop_codon:yes gene_type:complete
MSSLDTIPHYAAILQQANAMKSRLAALAYDFKETAARTDLDVQLIDALIATANGLIAEAEALKSIAYDPTPEEPADP